MSESEIEKVDEREKVHYLKMKEEHPEGTVEDPRGRAIEYDFEIEADSDEELSAADLASSLFKKIMKSN